MNEHMSLWERKPHLHPSIHSSIHPLTHPPHPSTYPFTHPSIRSSTYPFTYSSTYPFTHPSINPPIHPSTHPPTHPSIHPPIHPLTHPSMYPLHMMYFQLLERQRWTQFVFWPHRNFFHYILGGPRVWGKECQMGSSPTWGPPVSPPTNGMTLLGLSWKRESATT